MLPHDVASDGSWWVDVYTQELLRPVLLEEHVRQTWRADSDDARWIYVWGDTGTTAPIFAGERRRAQRWSFERIWAHLGALRTGRRR